MTAPLIPHLGVTGVIQDPGIGGVLGNQFEGIAKMLLLRRESDQRQQQLDQLNQYYNGMVQNEQARLGELAQQHAYQQAIQSQVGLGLTQLQAGNEQMASGLGGGVQIPGLHLPGAPSVSGIAGQMHPAAAAELFKQGEKTIERRAGAEKLADEQRGLAAALNQIPDPNMRRALSISLSKGLEGATAEQKNLLFKSIVPEEADPEVARRLTQAALGWVRAGKPIGEAFNIVGAKLPDGMDPNWTMPKQAGVNIITPQDLVGLENRQTDDFDKKIAPLDKVLRPARFGSSQAILDRALKQDLAAQNQILVSFVNMLDNTRASEGETRLVRTSQSLYDQAKGLMDKLTGPYMVSESTLRQMSGIMKLKAKDTRDEMERVRKVAIQRAKRFPEVFRDPEGMFKFQDDEMPTEEDQDKKDADEVRKGIRGGSQ